MLAPTSLVLGIQPATAYTCSGTQANLVDSGGGHMQFSSSQYCGGSDITQVKITNHVQRCTQELFGCKAWGDILSWTSAISSAGTVTNSHVITGLTCGNLYHTWGEGEGWVSSGRVFYGSAWSGQAWYGC
jgi:hypothetical protein